VNHEAAVAMIRMGNVGIKSKLIEHIETITRSASTTAYTAKDFMFQVEIPNVGVVGDYVALDSINIIRDTGHEHIAVWGPESLGAFADNSAFAPTKDVMSKVGVRNLGSAIIDLTSGYLTSKKVDEASSILIKLTSTSLFISIVSNGSGTPGSLEEIIFRAIVKNHGQSV